MLGSEVYRDFKIGKWYYTFIERTMSDNGSIEEKVAGNSSENVDEEVSESQTLTQQAVNEQSR